jgi:hypothetical protein
MLSFIAIRCDLSAKLNPKKFKFKLDRTGPLPPPLDSVSVIESTASSACTIS